MRKEKGKCGNNGEGENDEKEKSRTKEKGKKGNGEWMRGGKVGNKHGGNGG